MPRKRPFGVTLLLWLVLMVITWGTVRFVAAMRGWEILVEFRSSLSPVYLSMTGAGWGVAGCVLLWSIFAGRAWATRAILISTIVWLAQYWLERVLFQSPRVNWPFALAGTVVILSLTFAVTLHKSTRDFFTRSEEYEQQIENSGSQ